MDFTVILWDINRLSYISSIIHNGPVYLVTMSYSIGDIATFSINAKTGENILTVFTINRDYINSITLKQKY
jgi:hypothetical protein